MGPRTTTKTLHLKAEDIDLFSDWFGQAMSNAGVDKQNQLRVRLWTEEILLRLRDHLGEITTVRAIFSVRLRRPRLRLEVDGSPYNPLGQDETELGSWASSLRTGIGLSPQYSYDGVRNVIRLAIPHPSMNPVLRIVLAILLGVLLGLAGNAFISQPIRKLVTDIVLQPVYNVWNRILNAVSGPIIFLTVATTLLNTQRIAGKGGSSVRIIARYFLLSIFVVTLALFCGVAFFPLEYIHIVFDRHLAYALLDGVLMIIPLNIVEPFATSNTSQLLVMAFVLGYILVHNSQRVPHIIRLVREGNMIGLQLAKWVSELVPPIVGAFLCLELWVNHVIVLTDVWQPLVISLLISLLAVAAALLHLSWRQKVRPLVLLGKVWEPFFETVKTGSLDASFAVTQASCTRQLGIDAAYVKEALPQGLVLYMPVSAIGTIVFTLFTAKTFGVLGNSVWYVSAIVMAVVVFVATPPVPGANLLAYVALFATLGIPEEALLDAMIFDIVFGIFAGAANQTLLQVEMVQQADRYGMLDKDLLKS